MIIGVALVSHVRARAAQYCDDDVRDDSARPGDDATHCAGARAAGSRVEASGVSMKMPADLGASGDGVFQRDLPRDPRRPEARHRRAANRHHDARRQRRAERPRPPRGGTQRNPRARARNTTSVQSVTTVWKSCPDGSPHARSVAVHEPGRAGFGRLRVRHRVRRRERQARRARRRRNIAGFSRHGIRCAAHPSWPPLQQRGHGSRCASTKFLGQHVPHARLRRHGCPRRVVPVPAAKTGPWHLIVSACATSRVRAPQQNRTRSGEAPGQTSGDIQYDDVFTQKV